MHEDKMSKLQYYKIALNSLSSSLFVNNYGTFFKIKFLKTLSNIKKKGCVYYFQPCSKLNFITPYNINFLKLI